MLKSEKIRQALKRGRKGNALAFADIANCDTSHARRCLDWYVTQGEVSCTNGIYAWI